MKTCKVCGKSEPVVEFYKQRRICTSCYAIRNKESYLNKTQNLESNKEAETLDEKAYTIVNNELNHKIEQLEAKILKLETVNIFNTTLNLKINELEAKILDLEFRVNTQRDVIAQVVVEQDNLEQTVKMTDFNPVSPKKDSILQPLPPISAPSPKKDSILQPLPPPPIQKQNPPLKAINGELTDEQLYNNLIAQIEAGNLTIDELKKIGQRFSISWLGQKPKAKIQDLIIERLYFKKISNIAFPR
jgi:hypothetical protein